MGKIRNLRWWIIGMIFFASVMNYIDRQALSILAPTVQKELGLTNQDYALVVNLFLVAYTISYIVSGRVVDKLGVRLSLALFIGWWSVANMLTAFSRSLGSLGAFRFLLGLGEAGNWTAAPKARTRPRDRYLHARRHHRRYARPSPDSRPCLVAQLAGSLRRHRRRRPPLAYSLVLALSPPYGAPAHHCRRTRGHRERLFCRKNRRRG